MVELRLGLAFKFGNDALGENLSEFDAPLIEGIDVPDDALGEYAVFVERNELSQRCRSQPVHKDSVGWSIAVAHSVRDKPIRRTFGLDLLGRFSEGERLSLREDIREQQIVVPPDRVERLSECDEIARNEPRALMDQLIERVLAIGSGLAPIDRAGLSVDRCSGERYVLAVALHHQLLEIGWETLQVLVVGKHRDGLRAVEVVVPNAEESHEHRKIALKRRGASTS